MLLFSVSMFGIAAKPVILVWVLLIGPALFLAFILSLEACREFRGLPPRLWMIYAAGAAALAAVVTLEIMGRMNVRIAVASSFFALMALLCCVTLLKNVPSGNSVGSKFTAGLLAVFALISVARATYYLLAPPLTGFYDTVWIGAFSYYAQDLFIVFFIVGWLVMTNERRLVDLKQERAASDSIAQRSAALDAKKTDLIGVLGHEVRNPLAGLSAVMELMLDTELTAEQREYARTADASIGALLRVTEEILELSKMESVRPRIESSPFNLYDQVEGIAKIVKPLAKAKGLNLVVDFLTAVPPLVGGDTVHLGQVIMNLVGNAIKFTSQGQIRIAVAYRQRDAGHGELQVTVSDTGIGIAPEHIPTLFEKGGRAHASTAQAYGGLGIGLPLCWDFVDLMGGHLEVESQLNQGSTFRVSLPLAVLDLAHSAGHR